MLKINDDKRTNYGKLQSGVNKRISPMFRSAAAKDTLDQLLSGENTYLRYTRLENTAFDPRWIKEIEDCLYDLGEIVKNPRTVTSTLAEVVPVELARKTNAESVQHLASHTQYIKDVDEHNQVIPNKILNIGAEDFLKTYENRFIATLIRKLVLFIEKRASFFDINTQVRESEVLLYKNRSMVDGKEVEIETKIKVVSDNDVSKDEYERNLEFAKRLEEIRRYVLYYYNSDFMRAMKTERNVRNPILMTNIIRKNKKYNHCYRLYKFLEKYEHLGVEFKTSDKYANLSKNELDEINNAMMVNFLALRGKEMPKKIKKSSENSYKPKILTTIDDDQFIYGPWLKTPFEFARVDVSYLDHLAGKKHKLPENLTKEEQKFYSTELNENKEIDQEIKLFKKVMARKKKEAKEEDKYFTKIVKKRDIEDARIAKEEKERKTKAILSDIEKARLALMKDAGKNVNPKSKKSRKVGRA